MTALRYTGSFGHINTANRCPVAIAIESARLRAAELGIKTVHGTLLYISERLEAEATRRAIREDNLSAPYRDAAAQCLAIANVEAECQI